MNQYDTLLAAIATLDPKEQAKVVELLAKGKQRLKAQVEAQRAAINNVTELIKKHSR